MLYATIVICLIGVGECDVEHAIFAEQSDADFRDVEECFSSAKSYIRHSWADIPALAGRPAADFTVDIYCTPTGTPA
jgi:hypothetical protein